MPDGAETLDVSGKTIIPGLVNLHVHYREGPEEIERQFRSQLHYGVTTARSIGSDSPERVAHLLASAGRPDAPRTYTAGTGFSYPGGFNAAGPQRPDHRGRGARAGAQPDRARRALHQDVGQRGRRAGPEDPAGDPGGHHRRSQTERRHPRRPHRRRGRRPATGRGRPAGLSAQHRLDLRPRGRRPDGRSRAVGRVHPDVPGQRRALHPHPVYRPEPLALRGASGAAGRPGVARPRSTCTTRTRWPAGTTRNGGRR